MTASWAGVCFDTPRARSFRGVWKSGRPSVRHPGSLRKLGLLSSPQMTHVLAARRGKPARLGANPGLPEALGALLVLPALGQHHPYRVHDEEVGHDPDPDERDEEGQGLPTGGDRVAQAEDVRCEQHRSKAYPP